MAKKKATPPPPQENQFEEVAPPETGSEKVFTTSTPTNIGPGRIVGDDSGAPDPDREDNNLYPKTSSLSLEQASSIERELSEVPQGAVRPNKRAARIRGVSKAQVTRHEGTDDYTLGILQRINADRQESSEINIKGLITKRKNAILSAPIDSEEGRQYPHLTIYANHEAQGGCRSDGDMADKCPTLQGKRLSFKDFMTSHAHVKYVREAKEEAKSTAEDEIRNGKDIVTGAPLNGAKLLTPEDLKTSNNAQHLERLYKLSDLMYEDHVARSRAAGVSELPREAYSPKMIRAAIHTHIKFGRDVVERKSYVKGVGREIKSAPNLVEALKTLPSIAMLWRGKSYDATTTHIDRVHQLWSALGKARSRNLQKQNAGSDIAKEMASLPPEKAKLREDLYDAKTRQLMGPSASMVEDLHSMIGAVHNEKVQRARAERGRVTKAMSPDEARTAKALATMERQEVIPTLTGEEIAAGEEAAGTEKDPRLQAAYQDHENQHKATRRERLAALGSKPSLAGKASAMFDTCTHEECNQARRSASGEGGTLGFSDWMRIHGPKDGVSSTAPGREPSFDDVQGAITENRRRTAQALRAPSAVDDLLSQGNNTANGSGTEVPNNNADDALSQIQKAVQSGAIITPSGRNPRRGTVKGASRQADGQAVIGKNLSLEHWPIFKTLPPNVRKQMLNVPMVDHPEFLNAYNTHVSNELSKVRAAAKKKQTYIPQEFKYDS